MSRFLPGGPWRHPAGIVALFGSLCLAGCGDSKNGGAKLLRPRDIPFLENVPVPSGFGKNEALDFESGNLRMAAHAYVGDADPYAVRKFYRDQMPLMGWDFVTDQDVDGVITIRYEKSDEVCTIQIRSEGQLIGKTEIRIEVFPFTRRVPQAPRRPVP